MNQNNEQLAQTQDDLAQSEHRYKVLAEVSPVGIFHTDTNGNTTYVNPFWCKLAGMTKRDAMGTGWVKALHPDDRSQVFRNWESARANETVSVLEYRFLRPDGSICWVIGQAIPERNAENEIIGYIGTTTDITDRKRAEEEVARLLKEKQTVLNRINDGMVSLDNEWRYTFLNKAALQTHPLGLEATLGKVIWEVHPEMIGGTFWHKYHEAKNTASVVEFEEFYPAMHIWFQVKVYPSPDGLTIVYRDVSKRKLAEQINSDNEKRFRTLIENSADGITVIDKYKRILEMSPAGCRILGLPPNTRLPDLDSLPIHPDDRPAVAQLFNTVINDSSRIRRKEFRIIQSDGNTHWIECSFNNLLNESYLQAIVLNFRDITDRMHYSQEIMREKQLSDSIINSLPGVFYLYNQEGKFLRWNRNFETVTGYSGEEISKMHPLDFFHADDRVVVSQKIDQTFATGEDYVQTSFLLKSGDLIPYYFTGSAIEYNDQYCLVGVGIDFSQRIKAQELIMETTDQLRQLTAHLQKVREEERRRIGREIHDELGQQLTAIKMDIAWIDKRIAPEEELLKNKLKNVIGLLDGSNQSIRRILSELRPGIFDNTGLIEALEWLGSQLTETAGIPVQFVNSETKINISEPVATCIFRVYQEALTNIMKYAQAKKVWTSLSVINEQLIFSIEDDGKGFDANKVQANHSFGLLGMKERVLSLQGVFELTSSAGNGTHIVVRLPLI